MVAVMTLGRCHPLAIALLRVLRDELPRTLPGLGDRTPWLTPVHVRERASPSPPMPADLRED